MNKELKRLYTHCLCSCGGCEYMNIKTQHCKKHKGSVCGWTPACEDYKEKQIKGNQRKLAEISLNV